MLESLGSGKFLPVSEHKGKGGKKKKFLKKPTSKKKALKRLRQVEYFKHNG